MPKTDAASGSAGRGIRVFHPYAVWSKAMYNIFYIIGVIVVVLAILSFLGIA